MKLLYLMSYWPSLFITDLFREIQWLRQRGHSVAVVSLGHRGPKLFESETRDQVELARFGVDDVPVLQLDARNTERGEIIREIAAFNHKHEAELAIATEARLPGEVACDLCLDSGIPFAVRMRGGDTHSNTSPRLAEMLQHASAVCPMSQFLSDILTGKRILKKTPAGIPAKVSSAKLHLMPGSLASSFLAGPIAQSDDTQVIGAIGRAVRLKRFPDIIHAVAGLVADFPGLRLKIVGGGELLPELQELAVQVGIGDRFEITGFHKSRDYSAGPRVPYLCASLGTGGISPVIARSGVPGVAHGAFNSGIVRTNGGTRHQRVLVRARRRCRAARAL